jgi:hypothetical protein
VVRLDEQGENDEMRSQYGLKSKFELEGVFWLPDSADEKFPAHLSCGENLELTTGAVLSEVNLRSPERLFGLQQPLQAQSVLHGITNEGICTLLGLQEVGNPSLVDFREGFELRVRRFRIQRKADMGTEGGCGAQGFVNVFQRKSLARFAARGFSFDL